MRERGTPPAHETDLVRVNKLEAAVEKDLRKFVSRFTDGTQDQFKLGQALESFLKDLPSDIPAADLAKSGNYAADKLIRLSDGSFIHVTVTPEYDIDVWSAKLIDAEAGLRLLNTAQAAVQRRIAREQANLDRLERLK